MDRARIQGIHTLITNLLAPRPHSSTNSTCKLLQNQVPKFTLLISPKLHAVHYKLSFRATVARQNNLPRLVLKYTRTQ